MAKIHGYKERPTRAKREGSPVPCVELYDTRGAQTINVAEELVKNGHAEWEKVDTKETDDDKSSNSSESLIKTERTNLNGAGDNTYAEVLLGGKKKTNDKLNGEKCDENTLSFADIERSVIENGSESASSN